MLTKTRIGNYLRRHTLGDQPTFRQGFKEGIAFALKDDVNQRRLTDAEILLVRANLNLEAGELFNILVFARAIESKLLEKSKRKTPGSCEPRGTLEETSVKKLATAITSEKSI